MGKRVLPAKKSVYRADLGCLRPLLGPIVKRQDVFSLFSKHILAIETSFSLPEQTEEHGCYADLWFPAICLLCGELQRWNRFAWSLGYLDWCHNLLFRLVCLRMHLIWWFRDEWCACAAFRRCRQNSIFFLSLSLFFSGYFSPRRDCPSSPTFQIGLRNKISLDHVCTHRFITCGFGPVSS